MATFKDLLGSDYKEGMTLEEIEKALADKSFVTSGEVNSKYVAKAIADKYASEAADYKKKYRETLSEAEKKAQEEADAKKELTDKLEALERADRINKSVNQYIAMGYDEALAKSTAEAFEDGKMDIVFENQKTFIEAQKASLKDEVLKGTPAPPAGDGGKEKKVTLEQFKAMSYDEMVSLKNSDPDTYNELASAE